MTTKIIINVSGSQAEPVNDVTIRGVTVRDAAYTFLGRTDADIHYIPASSDWTTTRSGAQRLSCAILYFKHDDRFAKTGSG